MNKFLVGIVVMSLVLASMPAVMADVEDTATASVTVNEYISFTVTPMCSRVRL